MTEIMMLLAFITGAVTVYLAMRGSHYPVPSETPVKRLRTPKIEQVAVKEEETKQEESIEKALHEMRPPNIFERRQQIENIERQQEKQRKKEIWGIQ